MQGAWRNALARVVEARPDEARAMLWSFAYFFFLLASYFILRPLRDEMGVAAGRDYLQWLFTATFFVMLAAAPLYATLVARLPRRVFIPLVYHAFVVMLALFWAALQVEDWRAQTARVFFVWVSVFNLFAVSVFWSFMADLFETEQGKRLFGFIAAGGTAGTLLGSAVTVGLAGAIGAANLLIVAGVLLEIAVFCALRLERETQERASLLPASGEKVAREAGRMRGGAQPAEGSSSPAPATAPRPSPLRRSTFSSQAERRVSGAFEGFTLLLRSPYLAGIALWVALLSLAGTFLYFMQQDVVRAASTDPAVRTRIFATMDLAANLMTLALQFVVSGRVIRRIGVGPAAAILPLVFASGFAALVLAPGLLVIVAFQALQRTANFAFSNPAREILFTSLPRDEVYKAKNVIDTAIFRGGDVVWSWAFTGLRAAGLSAGAVAALAVPVMLVWAALALSLGRAQQRRAGAPKEGVST